MSNASSISFLPDDYLRRKMQRRANIIGGMLLVITLAAIGSAYVYTQRSLRRVEAEHAAIVQQYTEAAKQIEQVRQMQEQQRKLTQQAELTASLLEKVPRSYLLAELSNGMPPGVSLLDFNMESRVKFLPAQPRTAFEQAKDKSRPADKNAPPQEKIKTYEVVMKSTGLAETDVQVAQFINRLSRSKLLSDVNLVISDETEYAGQRLRKFQIEMTLNPAAEVTPATLKASRTAAIELN